MDPVILLGHRHCEYNILHFLLESFCFAVTVDLREAFGLSLNYANLLYLYTDVFFNKSFSEYFLSKKVFSNVHFIRQTQHCKYKLCDNTSGLYCTYLFISYIQTSKHVRICVHM
jgi:hypothetical protein